MDLAMETARGEKVVKYTLERGTHSPLHDMQLINSRLMHKETWRFGWGELTKTNGDTPRMEGHFSTKRHGTKPNS